MDKKEKIKDLKKILKMKQVKCPKDFTNKVMKRIRKEVNNANQTIMQMA